MKQLWLAKDLDGGCSSPHERQLPSTDPMLHISMQMGFDVFFQMTRLLELELIYLNV